MFPQQFSLVSLKRKRSLEIDESNDRPTKRVRIAEPSSSNEENHLLYTPVQAACTIIDEDEAEEIEVLEEILPRGVKVAEAERRENEVEALAAQLRQEAKIFSLFVSPSLLQEYVFGSAGSPPPTLPMVPIFIRPRLEGSLPIPPASPRTLPITVDFTSGATIRASLQHIRQQYASTPPRRLAEADVDAGDDDASESGDEDLPLFTEMMKPWEPASEPYCPREYPVYAEDLDPPEPQVDTRVIIHGYVGSASLPVRSDEEEDEETPEGS